LKLWCRSKPPSQTTVGHLMHALSSIYRNDLAINLADCLTRDATAETCSGNTVGKIAII
jgi:hypothetical protein